MKKISILILLGAITMALVVPALALEVKPTGRLYANFNYNLSFYPDWDSRTGDNDNATFEIDRAYLGLGAKFNDHWSAVIVSDVGREKETKVTPIYDETTGDLIDVDVETSKSKYGFYLKYAYGRYQPFKSFGLMIGSTPTPFIDRYEKAWGYRYVEKTPSDRVKWDSSADIGVVVRGAFPEKIGSYYVMLRNGEGYKHPDLDSGKAAHARILLTPFQMTEATRNLQLTVAYRYEREIREDPEVTSHMINTLLSYKIMFGDDWGLNLGAGFDFLSTNDEDADDVINGSIYHGYLVVYMPYNLALFGRVDFFDPDLENDEDTHGFQDESTYILGGISFDPIKKISFALDVKHTRYTAEVIDDEGDEVGRHPDTLLFVHTKFKF